MTIAELRAAKQKKEEMLKLSLSNFLPASHVEDDSAGAGGQLGREDALGGDSLNSTLAPAQDTGMVW
jgi:hypothetical protein